MVKHPSVRVDETLAFLQRAELDGFFAALEVAMKIS
jgi:hypothetical protein